MKNQHFGDINDYQKYGLLRLLAGTGVANSGQYKIGVCLMLTADDGCANKKFTHYLHQPGAWRHYDPPLFDLFCKRMSVKFRNDVTLAYDMEMLPGAKFYGIAIPDSLRERRAYFKRLHAWLTTCDLIFYDPDKGIETASCAKGWRNSAKYIYWDELVETYAAGHSVLVYQHFWREERTAFIQRMVKEYQTRLGAKQVFWFRTKWAVYFLSAQEAQAAYLAIQAQAVKAHWAGQIQVG